MNKGEFLDELALELQKMDDVEKNKFIVYYDEMISDYVENGMGEEEAIEKIGSPNKIAQELLEEYESVKLNLPSTGSRALNLILTIIGFPLWGTVLLMIMLFVFSVYVLIWCIPFAAGAGSIGFFASSVIGIAGAPFIMVNSAALGLLQLGTSIAAIGVSILLGIAALELSKKFVKISKKFTVTIVSLFKKKVVIR